MKNYILLFTILILSLAVTSCRPEQAATEYNLTDPLSELSSEDEGISDENTGDDSSKKRLDEYIVECSNAQTRGALVSQNYTVSFPAAIECNFNEQGMTAADLNADGNGPRIDGKLMARIEQYYAINFPLDSTICDIDFNFPEQSMKYDDEIFLTMNNNVVMASQNYSTATSDSDYDNGLLVNDLGLMQYKWSGQNGMYNLKYGQKTGKYCLGLDPNEADYNQKCNIPPTDTLGQFKLDIPSEEIVKLGFTNKSELINFGFITVGDNDNGDCEHSAYSFDVTIKYITN